MPFEFIAKKGLITPANIVVTGSLTSLAGITGSLNGSASWARNGLVTSSTYPITASVAQTASNGAFAWGRFTYNGSSITQSTFNCSITRSAIGTYPVQFTNSPTNTFYITIFNGWSGSRATPTALTESSCIFRGQTTSNFSMSTYYVSSSTIYVPSDPTTASFVIFSY